MDKMTAVIVLSAIFCITFLGIVAMFYHINGTVFSIPIAAIAGLAGFDLYRASKQ